jgi:surface antigen
MYTSDRRFWFLSSLRLPVSIQLPLLLLVCVLLAWIASWSAPLSFVQGFSLPNTAVLPRASTAQGGAMRDKHLQQTRHQQSGVAAPSSAASTPVSQPKSCSGILLLVNAGETPAEIAARFGVDWMIIANANPLANPSQVYAGQVLCIPQIAISVRIVAPSDLPATSDSATTSNGAAMPDSTTMSHNSKAASGYANLFPYGQCTWWANQRYFQLHGVFVPWTTNANAWQWRARAADFGWHISATPDVGAIMVLQPGVQGASQLGHVAVVERVLDNGDVLASSMNWGTMPQAVTTIQFHPGDGVSFLWV